MTERNKMRKLYLRLVPLAKGGIPLNSTWREPSKPSKMDSPYKDAKDIYYWPTDALIEIDETQTGLQVLLKIIDESDKLAHLRALSDEQVKLFVSFYDMDDGHYSSHGPHSLLQNYGLVNQIDLSRPYTEFGRYGDPDVVYPKRLLILYPMQIEPRLLLPVTYDNAETRPMIWLDVDGVVNIAGSDESLTDVQRLKQCYGDCVVDWGVSFSPSIVSQLNRLSEKCDIYWMTSWRNSARFRLAPAIGLDDFAVWPGGKGSWQHCKNCDRPLIWIDDHLDGSAWDPSIRNETIKEVENKFRNRLLIPARLQDGHGLAMQHIEQIDAFIAQYE